MIAYDYPLLGLFWTMALWSLWITWIMCVFHVLADIFRNRESGGGTKALWTIFVIAIPWLGVLAYAATNGRSMSERDVRRTQTPYDSYSYAQDVASSNGGTADELTKLAHLKSEGVLTEAEYAQQKSKILA